MRPVPALIPKGRDPAQMDVRSFFSDFSRSQKSKTPTADWASFVCGVPPVQIRAGLTPHRRRRTRRTPSWRPNPQGWGFILGDRKRQPQLGPRSCAGFRQFRSARGVRRIEDGGHAVLQVGDPIRKAGASFWATENANRRLGLARVRGPASSDPRGAYAASKTADTPYSKLEAVPQVSRRTSGGFGRGLP